MQSMKECVLAAYRREKQDFVPCEETVMRGVMCMGDNYIGAPGTGFDAWGANWTFAGGDPSLNGPTPTPGTELIEDFENWRDHIKIPDVDSLNWEMTKRMVPEDRENTVVDGFILSGMFERMHYLAGFENSLCSFYDTPEDVHDFLGAMADYRIACIDRLYEIASPEILLMQDDWGMATNMLIPPDLWREFFKPHEKRFADHIHSLGMLYEHHSCGYITPIIGDLVEIGVDAISPLNVCNDLEAIRRDYGGKICLVGGLNNQMFDSPDTPEETVRAEVRRAIDAYAPGGAYIPNYIPTNAHNREIFIDEATKYGMAYKY